ncbi:MAG: IS66 family transposase [Planctomycetota bacterium]|nr:IS66 family transposase [Planctomycetota bacterium]
MAYLEREVFGQKSEQSEGDGDAVEVASHEGRGDSSEKPRRGRGKQRGAKGCGRRCRKELQAEVVPHDFPDGVCLCPRCGKPFPPFPGTEDSEEIHWEVRIVRRVHRRQRYRKSCYCEGVPGILTAPGPVKIYPKALFSIDFWVRLLMEKFLFQRPLCRILMMLEMEGLSVSQGTLTGGLKKLLPLLEPLYERILERSRSANHWQMDETRWLVFVEMEGKKNFKWWLWVVVTSETCCYLLEPTRSGQVPKGHLGEDAHGILNADRYSAYKSLGENILLAWCWSHIRRDFVHVRDGYRDLKDWASVWVERINHLFHRNQERLKVFEDKPTFRREDRKLRKAVDSLKEKLEKELAEEAMHPAKRKVLKSLKNHWKGATLFVDNPKIPMDNNESERRIRNPVVGRKNYYGSGALWSGRLAAVLFTLFQTLLKNGIDPQPFLIAWFETCSRNGGCAPTAEEVEQFLPWNLSDEQKAAWRYPKEHPT